MCVKTCIFDYVVEHFFQLAFVIRWKQRIRNEISITEQTGYYFAIILHASHVSIHP